MQLSQDQVLAYAQQAGPGGDPQTAAAVAMAESGGRTDAVGDQGTSFGLWQIHLPAHPDVSQGCALDPACAARAAYAISNGWTNFHPWTVFNTGAYQQFLSGGPGNQSAPTTPDLAGQAVVGTMVSSPWFAGPWEVTQGYGQTDYTGEPEGHGFAHWHAGVDIGLDSGTVLTLPQGLLGTARALDNPGGYGTALIVLLDGGPGVLLGHLRQRLVDDNQPLRGGDQLGASGSTGNSTGPHLHFEVRPLDSNTGTGIGRYGTDVNPSSLLLAGASASSTRLLSLNPVADLEQTIGKGIQAAVTKFLQGGQVALGSGLLLSGLLVTSYGLRGRSALELQRDVRSTLRRRKSPKGKKAAPPRQQPGEAARSRLRPNLQDGGAAPPSPAQAAREKLRRGQRLSAEEAAALGAVPR